MNTLNYFSTLLLLAFQFNLNAQISWAEDFNDNDLQTPILWQGDTQSFITNSNLQLQLEASGLSSPSLLGCRSTIINNASWEFYVQLDFSPSASNYAEVYLAADQLDPVAISQAYFLRIGGISGSADDVSLYVKEGNLESELIDGVDGLAGGSSVEMMIKVEKDSNHLWSLWVDQSLSGNYQIQGTTYDSSISESRFFVLWSRYTSTRADKFIWDSISVSGFPFLDLEPIKLEKLSVVDSNRLLLSLSEIPETNAALNPGNYRIIDNGLNPDQIGFSMTDSSQLYLNFNSRFESGKNYLLQVSDLLDRNANQMQSDSLSFVYYDIEQPHFGDVRITEFMADPVPSSGLPEVEYLELFNTTSAYFNLNHWSIADPSSTGNLSGQILAPNQYILLCELQDTALLAEYGTVMGVNDLPSLNNSEDQLWLRDSSRRLIDQLNYSSSWHEDELKRNGGWSLEMINPYLNCSIEDNFLSSTGTLGGSPGKQNTVYDDQPDTISPLVKEVDLITALKIVVWFNESLDTSLFGNYTILLQGDNVSNFSSLLDDGIGLQIELNQALDSGKIYVLECIGLYDCEGNKADTLSIELILPFVARSKEVVLNEILFNPKSGGIDFVELYNPTGRVFTLDGMWLGNSEDTASWEQISAKGKLLRPNELMVLSEDLSLLQTFHNQVNAGRHLLTDLPAFPNERGDFYLWNQDQKLLDHFFYHEEMHFELLSSLDGVSLERLDPKGESIAANFFSASSAVNFATPGRENSQKWPTASRAVIGFREKIFSPDNDGFQDLLVLDYQFEQAGFVGTIEVLDAKGRRVKQLINNQLLATEGSLRWDGISDRGSRVPIGIYILTLEAFHPSGDLVFKKLPFVVAGRLD